MTILRYRPISVLSTFDDVVDSLFDIPFGGIDLTAASNGGYCPAAESFIKGNELHLRAEIPGVDPKTVAVSLEDGYLCIKGERRMPEVSEESCVCLKELDYGSFNRCFHVPQNIDRENIHARYELGMIDVTIPLKESLSQKRVPIESTEGRSISIEEGTGEKKESSPEMVT